MKLEIVDWRAPIARRYYQKSSVRFSINEYDYKVILRRALRVTEGRTVGFKNEFLSVRDYLSPEEIRIYARYSNGAKKKRTSAILSKPYRKNSTR